MFDQVENNFPLKVVDEEGGSVTRRLHLFRLEPFIYFCQELFSSMKFDTDNVIEILIIKQINK